MAPKARSRSYHRPSPEDLATLKVSTSRTVTRAVTVVAAPRSALVATLEFVKLGGRGGKLLLRPHDLLLELPDAVTVPTDIGERLAVARVEIKETPVLGRDLHPRPRLLLLESLRDLEDLLREVVHGTVEEVRGIGESHDVDVELVLLGGIRHEPDVGVVYSDTKDG